MTSSGREAGMNDEAHAEPVDRPCSKCRELQRRLMQILEMIERKGVATPLGLIKLIAEGEEDAA